MAKSEPQVVEPGKSVDWKDEFPVPAAKVGLWLFIGAVVIMFAGFTSAYIVRSASQDWRPIPAPPLLWFNTAVLLLSSLTIHGALLSVKTRWGQGRRLALWLLITVLLGLIFLGGQVAAWWQLAQVGVYLQTNPASSFFYLLTAAHGVHLVGGLGFLAYISMQAFRNRYTPKGHLPVELCATYWHFLDGLWLYLFIFLFVVHPG